MTTEILHEITPLTPNNCFTIFSRIQKEFDFPLHQHDEMELNLIVNGGGARRIVGDHIGDIDDVELVLIGSNLPHGWFAHNAQNKNVQELTIQFHKDLLSDSFLKRDQLHGLRTLFEQAKCGILFSRETIQKIMPALLALDQKNGFDSVLAFLSILNDLSTAPNGKLLSDVSFTKENFNYNSRRIDRVLHFMNCNYSREITLEEVSKLANMPKASFSRFFKTHTGYTFKDSLNAIRLGHVARMLIDTTHSVSEIAFKCGFNNMANFNRTFKGNKGKTPKEFRAYYHAKKVFLQ